MPLVRAEARTTHVDCPNCAKTAEQEIAKLEGVTSARVDLLGDRLYFTFDSETANEAELRRRIEKLGHFRLIDDRDPPKSRLPFSRSLGWALLIGALIYAVGAMLQFGFDQAIAGKVVFSAATIVAGWDILRRALVALRHRRLDINALMSLAIGGAIALGDLHEAVVVVLLFSLANLLESYSLWRLSRNLADLHDFTSATALVKRGDKIESIDPALLIPGDIVILREGMKVPADGVISHGKSFVDFSSLTGESQPRALGMGDEGYAGAVNIDGYLELRVTATVENSRIGKIFQQVTEASARKARIEQFVDRFARAYTPIVVGLAAAIAVLPPLLFQASFADWIYKALVFLVISCPCALVISTPVAVTTALAAASRMKAVVKGGDTLEQLARIDTVAFDKTGTLTTGNLSLADIKAQPPLTVGDALTLAAALEQVSQHPIARAVMQAAGAQKLSMPPVVDIRAIPGVGVEGRIDGKLYQLRATSVTDASSANGHRVSLHCEQEAIAEFSFRDELRPETQAVIQSLRDSGITRIGILSGDSAANTKAIADTLAVDFARGALLPNHKYDAIDGLGHRTAMVGDGINDIVALAGAPVSISLARFGSDIPAQHSDILLFGDSLTSLPELLRLGNRTLKVIKLNIAFAFAVKLFFLILAALGYANIWMAVIADMGASLAVIFNSLRLLRLAR